KKVYGWPEDAQFLVPDGIYDQFKNGVGKRGEEGFAAWQKKFADYKAKFQDLAAQIETMEKGELPAGWDKDIPKFPADAKGLATRDSSGQILNAIAKNVAW